MSLRRVMPNAATRAVWNVSCSSCSNSSQSFGLDAGKPASM